MLSDDIAQHKPLELYRAVDGHWVARPVSGYQTPLIERYGVILALWWRSSPSAVLECSTCGDVRLTGKRAAKNCGSCVDGKYTPMDLDEAFSKPRPRAKKVKLK